jgi:hypothetical protein
MDEIYSLLKNNNLMDEIHLLMSIFIHYFKKLKKMPSLSGGPYVKFYTNFVELTFQIDMHEGNANNYFQSHQ